ncbi:MAG TPA: sigma-54 dependent transcriptional regulator [Candidatus Sulfotelmatobacter sp.]
MSALVLPSFPPCGGALIASPSSALREQVLQRLDGRCRPVQQTSGGADALVQLEKGHWQVLYLDRRLRDLDVEELMAIIQRRFPGTQVVMVDSDASPEATVPEKETATAAGVLAWQGAGVDGRTKGTSGTETVREIEDESRREALPGMIGASEAMRRVYKLVRLVAPRTTTVLVAGPTGSGKELIARALHALSPRAAKPLVVVNCAAIPETLLESELFGFTRGAFTGAVQSQLGRIAAAHGGTLFLDEVSELPLGMQAKLLRFLEQKEIQRLGSSDTMRVDVRVVAASNVDLAGLAGTRKFREDLFYRLSAFPIELPALAERRADIIPLAEHFLTCMAAAMNMPRPRLSSEALRLLEAHSWRGNVRELQHVIERASILAESSDTVLAEHLYFSYFQKIPLAEDSAVDGASRSLRAI